MPDLHSPSPLGPSSSGPSSPGTLIKAGLTYWAVAFAAGFALGTFRVIWLIPRVGEARAVLIELPVILSISALAAYWLTRAFVLTRIGEALKVGALAFALLMAAEVVLAVGLFGQSVDEWLTAVATPPGLWSLLGQMAFAVLPAVMVRLRRG